MGITLLHGSFEPLLYGLAIFLGLLSMFWKLTRLKFVGFIIELFVFILVFKLHGGTMAGGFAATIAALLAGQVFPWLLRAKARG